LAGNRELKIKRPCTGYMLFISDFMKTNGKKFRVVQEAVSEGMSVTLQ